MHIPETISKHGMAIYMSKNTRKCVLDSTDFTEWHKNLPKRLNKLALESIVDNWEVNPLLKELVLDQDARTLLDSLPTNLPHQLIVDTIEDESYWKRCYEARWPKKTPLERPRTHLQDSIQYARNNQHSVHTRSWRRSFLEMHLQEALEYLKPEDYNPEKIKELVELCADFVVKLRIDQLQAPHVSHGRKDRIPLTAVLASLSNLTELCLCFKQRYAGEDFSWHIMQTTMNDIRNLAAGLKKSNLKTLRIINSDLDCDKVTVVIKSLANNKRLNTLDFSHCKIGDRGTAAIAGCLQEFQELKGLSLCNNFIGSEGVEILSYKLTTPDCTILELDLSLNGVGADGTNSLAAALYRNSKLESLKLAGCGLREDVRPIIKALAFNKNLYLMDLSSNKFGEEIGKYILNSIKVNSTLHKIDLRMSDVPFEIVLEIEDNLGVECPPAEPIDDIFKIFDEATIQRKIGDALEMELEIDGREIDEVLIETYYKDQLDDNQVDCDESVEHAMDESNPNNLENDELTNNELLDVGLINDELDKVELGHGLN